MKKTYTHISGLVAVSYALTLMSGCAGYSGPSNQETAESFRQRIEGTPINASTSVESSQFHPTNELKSPGYKVAHNFVGFVRPSEFPSSGISGYFITISFLDDRIVFGGRGIERIIKSPVFYSDINNFSVRSASVPGTLSTLALLAGSRPPPGSPGDSSEKYIYMNLKDGSVLSFTLQTPTKERFPKRAEVARQSAINIQVITEFLTEKLKSS